MGACQKMDLGAMQGVQCDYEYEHYKYDDACRDIVKVKMGAWTGEKNAYLMDGEGLKSNLTPPSPATDLNKIALMDLFTLVTKVEERLK